MRQAVVGVAVATIAVALVPWAVWWSSLPDPVATHWSFGGDANGHLPPVGGMLALSEVVMLAERAATLESERDAIRRAVRDDWERINVVPIDQLCLDRAAEIGRTQPVRTVDAIHLAAADRLPRPITFCTFDPRQIPVALALGFSVAST